MLAAILKTAPQRKPERTQTVRLFEQQSLREPQRESQREPRNKEQFHDRQTDRQTDTAARECVLNVPRKQGAPTASTYEGSAKAHTNTILIPY